MFGGNADRLQRQKGDGKRGRQQLAHPRQIGLADQDVGFERQMRAVLFDRRQRQHRDPARGVGPGDSGPVDLGPVAGRNRGAIGEAFL